MIPYKSIYKHRLAQGGGINNIDLFSLLKKCFFKFPHSASVDKNPTDYEIEGCLILKTYYYSLEHDENFDYALGFIELHEDIAKMFPNQNICNILAYQKNPESEKNPLKQKKIQILYEKDLGKNENIPYDQETKESKFLVSPQEISEFFAYFSNASFNFRDNKCADNDFEFLQIKILLNENHSIKNWTFFIDEEIIDFGDIQSYLNQSYHNIDPIEDEETIENYYHNDPESLFYLYKTLMKAKQDDVDKLLVCWGRAKKFAMLKGFTKSSREILGLETEKYYLDNDEEIRIEALHSILNQLQNKFIRILEKSILKNQENKEEEYKKEDLELENNTNANQGEEGNEQDNEDAEGNLQNDEEFHVNSTLLWHECPDIDPRDKLLFVKLLLSQDSISFKSFEMVREILENNPYDPETLAHCYFKIGEIMLEIIDERTSYLGFFGDTKYELFSLQGVEKYLLKAYNTLSQAFGNYDYKVLDVVFELLKVYKRMNNFVEAYKFCFIAHHIMKIYLNDSDLKFKRNRKRFFKDKMKKIHALSQISYVIFRNASLRKCLKRKEILIEMVINYI